MDTPKTALDAEKNYIKKIYRQIMYLAIFVHAFYVVLFKFLSYDLAAFYNVFSFLFYFFMLILIYKEYYRLTISLVHLEVSTFVVVCTILGGWESGIFFYLFALVSLVYFCPFHHRFVPYFFSAIEIFLFFVLKIYTESALAFYPPLPQNQITWLYLYNASSCFFVILYAAFLTNVSANVTKKRLTKENENLTELVNHDQLTGLLSRHSFLDIVESSRLNFFIFALGDIDNFKHVNDTYGHLCGDYVLQEVSRLISSHMDGSAVVCRWGGEEFLFFFHSQAVSFEMAKMQMEQLRLAISNYPFCYENHSFQITITFGMSKGKRCADYHVLIKEADEWMYQGKKRGKNQVVYPE